MDLGKVRNMSLKKLRKRVAEAECSIPPMHAELKELRFKKQVAQLDIQLVKGYIALKGREPVAEARSGMRRRRAGERPLKSLLAQHRHRLQRCGGPDRFGGAGP